MVYLNIKYDIATRNYDFLIRSLVRNERTPIDVMPQKQHTKHFVAAYRQTMLNQTLYYTIR